MTNDSHQVQSSHSNRRTISFSTRGIGLVALVVVLCALSFFSGTAYQKHHGGSPATAAGARGSGGGFSGARRSGGIGSVTAVSGSSITVDDQRSGSKTYSISSSTQISDNGSTVDYTDIKTGDTVLVTTNGSTSTAATRILVNPSFGGGGPGGTTQQSDGSQSQ
jgi:hypothetical protein